MSIENKPAEYSDEDKARVKEIHDTMAQLWNELGAIANKYAPPEPLPVDAFFGETFPEDEEEIENASDN